MTKLDDAILSRLRCMHTASPLHLADVEALQSINHEIANRTLRDRLGRTITKPFDAGLLNQEGTVFYPIINGIIQMMRDELIELDSSASNRTERNERQNERENNFQEDH